LPDDVRGGNKIDIVGSCRLQAKHLPGQLFRGHLPYRGGGEELADLPVLAEYTPQVTPGKEDGARATTAGNGRLLPMMQAGMGDKGMGPCATDGDLSRQTVCITPAGTAVTTGKLS